MRKVIFATALLCAPVAARAQSNLPTPGSVATIGGISVPLSRCTGASAASVTTTVGTVCNAGTFRYFWRITTTSGTSGTPAIACTDDGTDPTTTSYNWAVGGLTYITSGTMQVISPSVIRCVSFSGTVTIVADAVQTGVAP